MDTTYSGRSAVLHAHDLPDDARRAVGNAKVLGEAAPGIAITILVNGDALFGLAELDMSRVPEHTRVQACGRGLKGHNIDPATLPEGIEVVPSSPEAIILAQFDGAAYMRL